MQLDIRLPIGLLFSILGVVLTAYGLFTDKDPMYARSLGKNLNLWTGLGCLAFGLLMLLPALLKGKKKAAQPNGEPKKPEEATRT